MGYDLEAVAVAVLENGLGPVPDDLPWDGSTVPVACATWEPFGAVLFVRRWRNGQWDSDTAITDRAPDGRWNLPNGCGGSAWLDTGLTRPAAGEPLVWLGSSASGLPAPDGTYPEVVAHRGVASRAVETLRVEQAGVTRIEPVESSAGAVLVLGDADLPIEVVALDAGGHPLDQISLPALDLGWPWDDEDELEEPERLELTDVVGQAKSEAIRTLVRRGHAVQTIEVSDDARGSPGRVLTQTPAPGTVVEAGADVLLEVQSNRGSGHITG